MIVGDVVGYAATYAQTHVAGVVTEVRDVPLSTHAVEQQVRVWWKASGWPGAMSPWLLPSTLMILEPDPRTQ